MTSQLVPKEIAMKMPDQMYKISSLNRSYHITRISHSKQFYFILFIYSFLPRHIFCLNSRFIFYL